MEMQTAVASTAAHEPPVTQCQAFYFSPLFLAILAHAGSVLFRGKNPVVSNCFTALTFVAFFFATGSGTAVLTYMHQCLGMIATEGAIRIARAPLWAVSTRAELIAVTFVILPNLGVVLSETIFWHCAGVNMLTCRPRPLDPLDTGSFPSNPLYRKQHAVLHSAIVFLMISMGSSYWPRLRKSPKVQLVRMFIDPSCLIAIANVLATHSHGDVHHELESHPTIAAMMYVLAAASFISCTTQMAVAPGSDLTRTLPNGGPSVLLVVRLVATFSALILANFLYIDTFMEYLGCRTVMIKPGGDDNPSRVGWSPATELSTYLSLTAMCAVATLAAMILFNPTVTGLTEYTELSASGREDELVAANLLDDEERGDLAMGKSRSALEKTSSASSEEEA